MNEQPYNNQALNAYLLGALSAAEAERFDERSFTDEDFAVALSAAEKDLVDGYVRGELAGATLERFENYYLASDLRRRKVEFARSFQLFAEKNIAAANKQNAIIESKPKRNLKAIFAGIFTTSPSSLQWSFALATLALMIFGGWLFVENSRRQNQSGETAAQRTPPEEREKPTREDLAAQSDSETRKAAELARVREESAQIEKESERKQIAERERQPRKSAARKQVEEQKSFKEPKQTSAPRSIIASFVLTPQLRGGGLQTLSVPAKTAAVAMRLELESNEYDLYRVALKNPSSSEIVWQSGRIKSKSIGENKALNIRFPAKLLKPRTYTLEVSGINGDGAAQFVGDYPFRIVR